MSPGEADAVQGYAAAAACDGGTCRLRISHGATTREHTIEHAGEASEHGLTILDLDGDGADELVVNVRVVASYGPEGQMQVLDDELFVLDASTLDQRWHAAWASEPPEPQSLACTSEATWSDDDCDGRRETLVHVRRCDPPMCAGLRAGQPADSDYVSEECGTSAPAEERLTFRAAAPGATFASK